MGVGLAGHLGPHSRSVVGVQVGVGLGPVEEERRVVELTGGDPPAVVVQTAQQLGLLGAGRRDDQHQPIATLGDRVGDHGRGPGSTR
jgi:hypothetical protein